MTYGLGTRAFIEDGPQVQRERAAATRTTARFWRALDQDRRLELVNRALRPANDLIDHYPIAL